jgi:dipeptidyl aminopeptidase/acylaminoacyl peptidase
VIEPTDWTDLDTFVALPRVSDLAVSADGSRLVATAQLPDAKGAKYVSSLWEIDLDGGPAQRITWSDKGEASAAFLPDGSLLFLSTRPDSDGDEDESALWRLPPGGEATVVARSPGGLTGVAVAPLAGTVIVKGSRLVGSADAADDAERRKERKDAKVTAILHTGMPMRYWDHELGDVSPRVLSLDGEEQLRDLAPDAGFALVEGGHTVSADGAWLATTWRRRERGGRFPYGAAVIDVATGARQELPRSGDEQFEAVSISPDGRWLAYIRGTDGSFTEVLTRHVEVQPRTGGAAVRVELGDLFPSELAWLPDSGTLLVAGDRHGRAPVVAVDAATGAVRQVLADDGAYSTLRPAPDGRTVYALRSGIGEPPRPVRLDVSLAEQQPQFLAGPTPDLPLPGTVSEVSLPTPDGTLRGALCMPADSDGPVPLMLWIHGGPFMSYNAWSWRWNPWLYVARGWAVLLPDPPLSTGYGQAWLERAWPHRAAKVWTDLETLLDHVVARDDIDSTRTACLGASFGGYMTNWVAGHTDRFGAIVTHAGLWALDQQHTTTDGAAWKTGLFGTPDEHPEWYAQNSPNRFVEQITTPMLVIHGNRDYRVPISEALRLWWDLVSRFDGEPGELPHRFLQLTGENHWVLSPANARVWNETVLDFCTEHVCRERAPQVEHARH